ncbi:MAG TPA: RNA-guided endonuclease IscB [Ktedonosporobacter sp.]|nr:RNA-guided endonuclease IscB [Ktedonosporobacter sp.]
MKVFVLSLTGKPLMTTTPRRARIWLKAKRARVVRREPFTIQLRDLTTSYTQSITVGVDTGSKTVGLAATANQETLLQAEVQLRTDISEKLTQRRTYRRVRRSRKTRYRAPRFANRRRPLGWLPPSVSSKLAATLKAIHFAASLLPVRQVNVEIASFDLQKMRDPEITGISYQQGSLFGYQVREYLLEKWQRTCVYCGEKETALQIEHIVPKARGGSDRVDNLTLACQSCNQCKSNQTASEFGFPEIQAQALLPLRDAAHVSALKTRLVSLLQQQFGRAQVQVRYGYQTKYQRIQALDLPKSHTNDAVAITCEMGERIRPLETVYRIRCLPRGQYQRFNGLHSEHKCWASRKVRGFKLYEVVQVQGVRGYIAGRREKGAFIIKDVTTGKKVAEVTPRKLVRVARPTQGFLIVQKPILGCLRKESGASSPR